MPAGGAELTFSNWKWPSFHSKMTVEKKKKACKHFMVLHVQVLRNSL